MASLEIDDWFFTEKEVEEYLFKNPDAYQNWLDDSHFYDRFIKRAVDFTVALFLTVLFLPVLAIIALMIKLTSPGPIFYRGLRGAKGCDGFYIFKFRTMVVNAEQLGGGTTALNDPRITRLGGFLRKTKLDEAPQILNVLCGDMSFVGPRPELLQYTKKYSGNEQLILQVRPGITDVSSLVFIFLDEVVGEKNADEVYERLVLKRKNLMRIGYVLFQSPLLDTKLICFTVWRLIQKIIR